MSKTEHLYYNDPNLLSFEATVVEWLPSAHGDAVVLDRSAFYPTSGGQPFDTGTLFAAGAESSVGQFTMPVHEVSEREPDGAILHHVRNATALAPGTMLRGQVDEARRRDHMQQHSGQHVLSAAFLELLQAPTVSFHLGAESATIDLECPSLSADQIAQVEDRANRIANDDVAVSILYASPEEARTLGLRKLPPRSGDIRIIDIAGVDRTACGGTHVRSTGQIGPVLLRKVEKVRQAWRVEFLCGARAVRASRREHLALTAAAESLSAHWSDLPGQLGTLLARQKDDQKKNLKLLEQLADYEAAEIAAGQGSARFVAIAVAANQLAPGFIPAATRLNLSDQDAVAYARLLAQRVIHRARSVDAALVFAPAEDGGVTVMLATNSASQLHAGNLMKPALTAVGGRGGGSRDFAQGGLAASALPALIGTLRSSMG